jgi:hypothetical protein
MGGDQTDVEEFVRRRVKLFLHGVLPAETPRNRLTP